jgi:hypothetical protein
MGARLLRWLLVPCILAATVSPAQAQYFGRNKVRYDDTGFQTLQTAHFDIYFRPDSAEAAQIASRLAERWYLRLSRVLEHELSDRQPLILYSSHAAFEQTNVVPGLLGDTIGGVTEGQRRRILLPFDAGLAETNHVIGHEIVHAFQYDIAKKERRSLMGLPLWFIEGMAEYLSVGPVDQHTAMTLRDAALYGRFPSIRDLGTSEISPYRSGQAFWAWLAGRYGDSVIPQIFRARPRDVVRRIETVTGATVAELTESWQASIKDAWADLPPPTETVAGKLLIGSRNGGRINIAPALSPDGSRLIFLSEKDRLSIDVFIADTTTGDVQRKLVTMAADPHFESLDFLRSSGAWSPEGDRVLLSTVRRGRPVLAIYDVDRTALEREVPVNGVDQIFQPSWSPDGRFVVFTALARGLSDLYLFDLTGGELTQLTHDPFTDLQPAWSPDGRRLAFVTDRFSTVLEALSFGRGELAVLDIATRAIEPVRGLPSGVIDPQWTGDGSGLYFRASPTGVPNVFHFDLETRELSRLTDVSTGVSGITTFSPALSVARSNERLAFSMLRNGRFEIRTLDTPSGLDTPEAPLLDAARIPGGTIDRVATLLADPAEGLPAAVPVDPKPYISKLGLDAIGQPYFSMGAGGGGYGSFVRGGTSFLFGDLLGDRRLGVAVQAGNRLEDVATQIQYVNRSSRWTWGASGALIPNVYGWRRRTLDTSLSIKDAQMLRDDYERQRQMHVFASGVVAYPFGRSTRVELRGGIHTVQYDLTLRSRTYELPSRKLVSDETDRDAPAPPTMRLFEASVAFVRDTAIFGAVSPVLGNRVRLELTPSLGNISFVQTLADYRRYWMPARPFTLALRVLHAGRHGSHADDLRLIPISLRRSGLLRGSGSGVSTNTCVTSSNAECDIMNDPMIGSKVLAGQLELRFPLLSVLSLTRQLRWGVIPLEGVAFADAGTTWGRGRTPAWFGGHRASAQSAGAGVRVNAGGFVLEFDAVRRLDRAGRGWTFDFNLMPGF